MEKRVALYARVSLEVQTRNDAVSIDQQLSEMHLLCDRNSWEAAGIFIDKENYRAIQPPSKGMIVNPSGERSDRPQFLEMLEFIRSGDADIVLCWRDDRLVRHPRVAVALEDALDIGDKNRNGRPNIQILDATGAVIDRFTLSIKATVWREENKRRAERIRMGKNGSLQEGRWPGEYRRYGYRSVKIPGKRGRVIELNPESAPFVQKIFEMYDAGIGVSGIRAFLIKERAPQIYISMVRHEWSKALISRILRTDEYLGKAQWRFNDGTTITKDIPQIIDSELWHRVQVRMDRNKVLSTRNARGVYLLQQILYCGDCGNRMHVARGGDYSGGYGYRCHTASHNPHENHPKPYSLNGRNLDEAVWREIVDRGLKCPEIVREQIEARVRNLQAESEDVDNAVIKAQVHIEEIGAERIFFQRQAARKKVTEDEFDRQMEYTAQQLEYWQDELKRLVALKYDTDKVQNSLEYAEALFAKLRERLAYLDCDRTSLEAMEEAERNGILKERQLIIRTLVDRVIINSERHVVIEGVLDGSEGTQFELGGY